MLKTLLILLLSVAAAQAQLAVTVSPLQVTGDKAIVPLELKNQFTQGVASARAAVLLLDEQGKLVANPPNGSSGRCRRPQTPSLG
jgi:hypothetical protein